jgi:vacuolar-type H+-ATPase subunit E/Vma4
MRRRDLDRASEALQPVRAALLRRASDEAARTVEIARRGADSDTAAAKAQADADLQRIAADAEAQALAEQTIARTQARRHVRAAELAAQRQAYDEFCSRVTSSVVALRQDPAYPDVRDRMIAKARRVLGPDASIVEHPDGGVIAVTPVQRLDLSFPAVADRAVVDTGARVAELWSR